jgi:toluene monooxygenase system protein E
MSQSPTPLPPLKTWSHLARDKRRPTEYEVVSVGLHYHTRHPACPWELDPQLFMNRWYREHREGGALYHPDWDRFRDPDSIIYRGYIKLQADQETHIEQLVDQYSEREHDAGLTELWRSALARWYTPGRYPRHALQMAAAYGGQMAPASTITNCFFFQAADEARLTQRIAYRTAELRQHCPAQGFGAGERLAWESSHVWQGFRELIEKMLVAWDWGETFVALNLVVKPALDEAGLSELARAAQRNGDELLRLLCEGHQKDVARSRRWTAALVDLVVEEPRNREVIRRWIAKWEPLADKALRAYLYGLPGLAADAAFRRARGACLEFRASLGCL